MTLKTWSELVSADEDALPLIKQWVNESPYPVNILECDAKVGQRVLHNLQISTRSPLGSIGYHTGGLLVDNSWLRILGAGCDQLPRSLDTWNGIGDADGARCANGMLVADDVIGGFFAWFNEPQTIHYLSPDTASWENLELGYTEWLQSILGPGLNDFYGDLRWEGWQNEISDLSADSGIFIYPPLFADGPSISERSRKAVPVIELWGIATDFESQLKDLPSGSNIEIKFSD